MLLWLRTLLTILFPLIPLQLQMLSCLSVRLIIFPLSLLKALCIFVLMWFSKMSGTCSSISSEVLQRLTKIAWRFFFTINKEHRFVWFSALLFWISGSYTDCFWTSICCFKVCFCMLHNTHSFLVNYWKFHIAVLLIIFLVCIQSQEHCASVSNKLVRLCGILSHFVVYLIKTNVV